MRGKVRGGREALRAESPQARARRLQEQPKYHRNYDPITLRLFATLDAEDTVARGMVSDEDKVSVNAPAPDERGIQSSPIDPVTTSPPNSVI